MMYADLIEADPTIQPTHLPTFLDMAVQLHSRKKQQRRICEYLGLRCTHFQTIFSLPRAIRFRIYDEAGLVTETDINLNGRPDADTWPSAADCGFTSSLLLTCRTVYTEASSAVYSTNQFWIRYRDSHSLQRLRNLTPQSLSLLTHLTVHLNVSSCEIGESCCKAYPGRPKSCDAHDKPIRLSPSSRNAVLSEWQSTIERIQPYLTSSRLHLYFVCDVVDIETARQAVLPLLGIPTLASCAIRLSRMPDPLIRQLASTTAMRAMGHPSYQSESPFRFMDFPGELRRQIFEFTDLVTPLCETEWNSLEGYNLRYSTWRCGGDGDCEPSLHYACQFRNCWQGSNDGCFCSHSHAAFSSKCHCWSPPTSLFLVCRALLEDARAVFFMRNRFVIINPYNPLDDHAFLRLAASTFLTDIVPFSALSLLRDLELVFPLAEGKHLRPHDPSHQDWIRTINLVKDELCLPLLTLRIYTTDLAPTGPDLTLSNSANTSSEEFMVMFRTPRRVTEPLSKLKGLKAFFAHFARVRQRESLEEQIQKSEQKIERLVMGSDYDSSRTLEKDQARKSQWFEVALNAIDQC